MHAAYILEPGPADNILIGDLPAPRPSSDQVLVRVTAASVNPIDVYLRSGATGSTLPSPYILGSDFAGVVESCGANATRFAPGTRVWGANQGILGRQGTFAEFAAIDESFLYPIPDGVVDEQAAALALVGITAHLGLVEEARIQPGETIVVHGAGGAVGASVVRMAKLLGARVIAVTHGEEKLAAARTQGADATIDYGRENVAQRVGELAPNGVDVWWETSRQINLDLAVSCAAPRCRILLMAGRDARPQLPAGPFYTKCCRLIGFVMFQADRAAQRRAAEQINRWTAAGELHATIDQCGTLADAAEFHRLQEEQTLAAANTFRGKLVVRISE